MSLSKRKQLVDVSSLIDDSSSPTELVDVNSLIDTTVEKKNGGSNGVNGSNVSSRIESTSPSIVNGNGQQVFPSKENPTPYVDMQQAAVPEKNITPSISNNFGMPSATDLAKQNSALRDNTQTLAIPVLKQKNVLGEDVGEISDGEDEGVKLAKEYATNKKNLDTQHNILNSQILNTYQDIAVAKGDTQAPKLFTPIPIKEENKVVNDLDSQKNEVTAKANELRNETIKKAGLYASKINANATTAGLTTRAILGEKAAIQQSDFLDKGLPVAPSDLFYNDQQGLEALSAGIDEQYKDDLDNPEYVTKKNDIQNQYKTLIDKYPEFKRQQVAKIVAQEIMKEHPNADGMMTLPFGVEAAKKLGLSEEDIKNIDFDNLPIQSPLSSAAGAVYNGIIGLGAGAARILGTAVGMDKDVLTSNLGEATRNATARFEDVSNTQGLPTIVDADKTSPTYLQDVVNPEAGKYNYNFHTISNAIGHGVGALAQFIGGTKIIGGVAKDILPVVDATEAGMAGLMVGQGYEPYYQKARETISDKPEDEWKRHAYALINGSLDYYGFKALGKVVKSVSPNLEEEAANIFKDASSLAKVNRNALTKWTEKVIKGVEETVGETAFVGGAQAGSEIAKNIVDNTIGTGEAGKKSDRELGNVLLSGVESLPFAIMIPVGLSKVIAGARGSFVYKENLYNSGLNPETYLGQATKLFQDGIITQDQLNQRAQVINTATKVVNSIPSDIELNHNQRVAYTNSKVRELALKAQAEKVDDAALEKFYNDQIKQEVDARTEILNGGSKEPSYVKPETNETAQAETKVPDTTETASTTNEAVDNVSQKAESGTNEADLINQAKDIVNTDVVKGFSAETLKDAANNKPEDFKNYLSEIALQAHDENSVKATVDTYGQPLVDIATKLFPKEETQAEQQPIVNSNAEETTWERNIKALVHPETGLSAVVRKTLDEQQPLKDAFLKRIGLSIENYRRLDDINKEAVQQQWIRSDEFKQLENKATISKEPTTKEVEGVSSNSNADVKSFQQNITPKQLKDLLNKEGAANKTASGIGATKRQAGDYLYSQDRGSFDALLNDIKSGSNKESWQNLFELSKKEKQPNERTTTEVSSAIPTEIKVPKEQGNKEAVQPSTESVGQSNAEASPTVLKEGKYKAKAKKIADDIRKAELPSWLVNTDPTIKQSGVSAESLKNTFADAVELAGELLDKGVEVKDAIKQAADKIIDHILTDYPKGAKLKAERESQIRDGFEKYYNDNIIKGEEIKIDAGKGNKPPIEKEVVSEGEDNTIGIRHVDTAEMREEFSLPEYQKEVGTIEEWNIKADERIRNGQMPDVIKKFKEGDIPSKVEQVMMGKYIAELENKASETMSDKDIAAFHDAVKLSDKVGGSEAGASLRARQIQFVREDSLGGFLLAKMEANKVDVLTDKQKDEVKSQYENFDAAEKKWESEKKRLEDKIKKLEAAKEIKKYTKPKSDAKKTHEDYVKERQSLKEKLRQQVEDYKAAGRKLGAVSDGNAESFIITAKMAKTISEIVKSHVFEIGNNLGEVTKRTFDDVKDFFTGISESDIHDVIAGRYNEPQKTRSQKMKDLVDLKTQARLVSKLSDLQNGKRPTTEKKTIERNREIAELRRKIADFEKENPDNAAKLATLKKRYATEIKKVQDDIDNKRYAPPPKEPSKIILDKEALDAKDELIRLKNERHLGLLREKMAAMSTTEKAIRGVAEIANIPRSIMSSGDLSAPLRQAIIPVLSHPTLALKSGKLMVEAAVSQKVYDRWFFDFQQSPRYDLMSKSKLGITESTSPLLTAREEAFMSNLAERIPIIGKSLKINGRTIIPGTNLIKGSERAYTLFLNKMRVDLFNRFASSMEDRGLTFENSPEQYKQMAAYVNNSTGRGDLGNSLNKVAPLLNSLFFSPRLIASRINMLTYLAQPRFYNKVPKEVRRAYFTDMSKFIALGATVLSLASLNKDDKTTVETNPTSSDFGKIRNGNTRWDIWGGFQQYIRVASQAIMGKRTSNGKTTPLGEKSRFGETRLTPIIQSLRGKLAPVPSMALDLFSGRTIIGDKVTYEFGIGKPMKYKEVTIDRYVRDHLLPLTFTGMSDALQDQGAKAWFTVGLPSIFGVGVQTYDTKKKKPSSSGSSSNY